MNIYIYIILGIIAYWLIYRILQLPEADDRAKIKALALNILGLGVPVLAMALLIEDRQYGFLVIEREAQLYALFGVLYAGLCWRFNAIYNGLSLQRRWPIVANNLSLTVMEDRARKKSKIPPVVFVARNFFRIKSLGLTIKDLKDKREQIERALGGIYINAIMDAAQNGGRHDCIDIFYSHRPLPKQITFRQAPGFKAGSLLFGRSEVDWMRFRYYDCRQIGIAGENGGGKTSFLLSLATQVICNDPRDVVVVIDYKLATEFTQIARSGHNILHLTDEARAVIALQALWEEHLWRAKFLNDNDFPDIYRANQSGRVKHIEHLWLFIDEANDLLGKEGNPEARVLVRNLCQKCRSTGIHPVLCTQRLAAENLGGDIKGELAKKIAFRLNTPESSRMWMGDTSANELPVQPGLAVVQDNAGQNIITQTLFITPEEALGYLKQTPQRFSLAWDKLQSALGKPNAAAPKKRPQREEIKLEDLLI